MGRHGKARGIDRDAGERQVTIVRDGDKASSTLCDVIAHAQDLLSASGLKTPIQVGSHYLTANQGSPPKIVFCPETGPGRIGPPVSMGKGAASMLHSCTVIVREKPGQGEAYRFKHAYELLDKVVSAVQLSGTGRIEWGGVNDASMTTSDGGGGGVGLQTSFTFKREIPIWDPLWNETATDGNERPIQTALALSEHTPLPPADESATLEADGTTITATVTPIEG